MRTRYMKTETIFMLTLLVFFVGWLGVWLLWMTVISPPYDAPLKEQVLADGTDIIYQDKRYIEFGQFLSSHDEEANARREELMLISWSYALPMRMYNLFYAPCEEDPPFIILIPEELGFLYMREDFAWEEQPFSVKETEIELPFSHMITDKKVPHSLSNVYPEEHKIQLSCVAYPELMTHTTVLYDNGDYYLTFEGKWSEAYQISDEFWDLLIEHDVITPAHDRPRNADAPSVPDNAS